MSLPSPDSRTQVTFTHGSIIRISGIPLEVFTRICDALTISNPKYAAAVRFSGWHPRNIEKYLLGYMVTHHQPEADGTYTVRIAPGFAAAAWGICQRAGLMCQLVDQRTPELLDPITYNGEVRPYQMEIVQKFNSRYGVLVAPCGSGKTDMGIQLMVDRNCRFLIIVHTLDLAEQWRTRIKDRTGITAAMVTGKAKGNLDGNRFAIATVQTLIKNPELVDQLSVRCDGVLVDECHHTPATTFTKVLGRMNPVYRFGITATLERNDGLTAMIHWWIGPMIAQLPQEELEAGGHVMRARLEIHTIDAVRLEHNPDEPGDHTRLLKEIVADQKRFEALMKILTGPRGIFEGVNLILCWTIDMCEELANRISNYANLSIATLHRKIPKKKRKEIIAAAQRGDIDVLIATTVADEGLDIPCLTAGWIVTPIKAAGKVQQRLGRLCRPREGKEQPVIHDLVDTGIWRWFPCYSYMVKKAKEEKTGETPYQLSQKWLAIRKKRFSMTEQFRHRFNKVYRQLCDYNESDVKSVIGK